ncbi:unnamed protein product, partial [Urochloa humidicola]
HGISIRSILGQVAAAANAGPGSGEEELQHTRARARVAAEIEASISLACSRRPAVDLVGSGPDRAGLGRRPVVQGLCSPSCSSAASRAPPPLLSAGEISRPAGARPVASAADLARDGRSSRGGGGPPHRRQLLPFIASMAGLYPHHPLLRRWRCGGEREQSRMPTSGVDLAVAELRTSGGADLSGGGHLRRPPPQLLAGLHLISTPTPWSATSTRTWSPPTLPRGSSRTSLGGPWSASTSTRLGPDRQPRGGARLHPHHRCRRYEPGHGG